MTSITDKINSLQNDYNNNAYVALTRINNESIMVYVMIGIVGIYLSKRVDVSLSLVFLIFVAFIICYLIYKRKEIDDISSIKDTSIKIDLIVPSPISLSKYPDVVDFLYSIRDFYSVNPNAFYAVVKNTEQFFYLYNQIMFNEMMYCTQNLEVANQFIRNAQNHLHSIIYNLDIDRTITHKYHESLRNFHIIANKYKKDLIKKCNSKFTTKSLNTASKYFQEYGPRPINYFGSDDANRAFEVY